MDPWRTQLQNGCRYSEACDPYERLVSGQWIVHFQRCTYWKPRCRLSNWPPVVLLSHSSGTWRSYILGVCRFLSGRLEDLAATHVECWTAVRHSNSFRVEHRSRRSFSAR